ncbi:helix-turn-helix domain-containing protein [Duganella sp. FT92W]|uniref:Helix-turn-helix domain-containing protein n=1 Tax=Pseudoduganella rivuli TaxID=2666085 RepID=A0A7X2IM57_9BURK|nr:AraC family transcriptional regulator [Pseudoduganella rivuli]MRV72008.1 helix-turn-helix domain-containing protein [Pseudoduganella rivuli]
MSRPPPIQPDTEPLLRFEFVRGMLAALLARGLDITPYLQRAGIAADSMAQADPPGVTTGQYIALFYAIALDLQDEGLAMFSRPFKPGSFALVARVGMSAPDLRGALVRMASTVNLLQDDLQFALAENRTEAGLTMRWLHEGRHPQPFLLHTLVRVFWRLAVWLTSGALRVGHFDFAMAAPVDAAEYAVAFPGKRHYGQAVTGFWFELGQLQSPVLHDDMALRAFLSDSFGQIIAPPRLLGQVSQEARNVLLRAYPEWPDVHAVARQMHMSRATLQRQLAGEGSSLQRIKDQLRRDLAISRLSTSDTGLAAIAAELGFSDSGSFQRAFKQWTGKACGEYRRAR